MAQNQQGFLPGSLYCLVYRVPYEQRHLLRRWLTIVDAGHIVLDPLTGDGKTGGFVYDYAGEGGKARLPIRFSYGFTTGDGSSKVVIWARPTVSANLRQEMKAGETDLVKGIEMVLRTEQVTSKNAAQFGTRLPVIDATKKIAETFHTVFGLAPYPGSGLARQSQMSLPTG